MAVVFFLSYKYPLIIAVRATFQREMMMTTGDFPRQRNQIRKTTCMTYRSYAFQKDRKLTKAWPGNVDKHRHFRTRQSVPDQGRGLFQPP